MKDPTQNELLSAYLDGELTADEQADVERLLADDPSARQLLDELRALSVALQDLPQETVGEDLGEAVLRAAARRVLLDGPPGESSASMRVVSDRPSIARRLFNVRGLTYAGLAAAFALMLLFVDWGGRELTDTEPLARATLKADATAEIAAEQRIGLPPPEQSVRDSFAESAPAPSPTKSYALKSGKRSPSLPKAAAPLLELDKLSPPPEAEKQAPRRGEVLVVHCDVTSEALADKSFEKLLVANGIVRNRRLDLSELNYQYNGFVETPKPAHDATLDDKKAESKAPPPLAENEVSLVYVEATPEQIKATLKALTAEPRNFSNIAMSPPPKPPVERLAMSRRAMRQGGAGAGEGRREKSADRGGDGMNAFGAAPPPGAENAAKPETDDKAKEKNWDEEDRSRSDAEEKGKKVEKADKPTSKDQEMPRRRVLFVLRNVSGDQPPMAAAKIAPAEEAHMSKTRQQEPPPPAEPPPKEKEQ